MSNNAYKLITVATDQELFCSAYYQRFWDRARGLEIPRRQWLDALADCFCLTDAQFQYASGEEYQIPDLDEAFGNDPEMRWLSNFLKADRTGMRPRHKSRHLERLRIIDLYLKVNNIYTQGAADDESQPM